MVHLAQTVHLSWVKNSTISRRIKMSFLLSLITKEYHRVHPKRLLNLWYVWCKSCTYLVSMVCLTQTMHPSCSGTNTISEQSKTRFHMSHVTLEFHQVCPKWFLSLWYVRRKPFTHLTSRLALSPNRPEWASTWASSPRSTIGCVQNNFRAYGRFRANRACIDANSVTP
jgi:hypothetical protein